MEKLGYGVTFSRDGKIWSKGFDGTSEWKVVSPLFKPFLKNGKKILRSKNLSDTEKLAKLEIIKADYKKALDNVSTIGTTQTSAPVEEIDKNKAAALVASIRTFFKDFEIENPSARFINTMSHHCSTFKEVKSYISAYFTLEDYSYKNDIIEKLDSTEFKAIFAELQTRHTSKYINSRFKVYYGAAGCGKTWKASLECGGHEETVDGKKKVVGARIITCKSTDLPSDLLEDFKFDDGKPGFHPSALVKAMEEGQSIVLDEINLLPFDSIRFLQEILDGKTSFIYKGNAINIKDGFKIIGTMNLNLGGQTYPLPEPLVDRAEDIKEFTLSDKSLADMAF